MNLYIIQDVTCDLCGGELRVRPGDPPHRGSCPNCLGKRQRHRTRNKSFKPPSLVVGYFESLILPAILVFLVLCGFIGYYAVTAPYRDKRVEYTYTTTNEQGNTETRTGVEVIPGKDFDWRDFWPLD